jgi:tRNA-splicing ligase RtcB
MVYDLAHNMAKFENHIIENKQIRVCVHRKGATRSFGPGSGDIPDRYQETGQPVLVPGSMGSSSWVLVGTQTAMIKSFGSCCHGAGRALSRSQAKREINGNELRSRLQGKGIFIKTGSLSSLSEEAPEAYKEVDEVVQCVIESGLAKKVARLRPVAVIKG